ncbi:hypothetical protein BHE74_00057609 [Ensete ventricosum]|nr:hypothetical protein BHE74_00057609 [Ensete ventricosum]RZS26696.1 hypothetical protein BHM03_00060073 [Ensete ventricosum]
MPHPTATHAIAPSSTVGTIGRSSCNAAATSTSPLFHYNCIFQPSTTAANDFSVAPVASVSPPTVACHSSPSPLISIICPPLSFPILSKRNPRSPDYYPHLPLCIAASSFINRCCHLPPLLLAVTFDHPHLLPLAPSEISAIANHPIAAVVTLICYLQPHQRSAMPPAAQSSVAASPLPLPPPRPLLPLPHLPPIAATETSASGSLNASLSLLPAPTYWETSAEASHAQQKSKQK